MGSAAGATVTELPGASASKVLLVSLVSSEGFRSNWIDALLCAVVPVTTIPWLAPVVSPKYPAPRPLPSLGGRNPRTPSVIGSPVTGSRLWKIANAWRVAAFTPAVICSRTPSVADRSSVFWYEIVLAGSVMCVSPNWISVSRTLEAR